MKNRIYPVERENQEFADFLSECSDDCYKLFSSQGIPPEVATRVRRDTNKISQDGRETDFEG